VDDDSPPRFPTRPIPQMEYFAITPSQKERRVCPKRFLVYGFPIPGEWFPYRYKHMKAAGMELDSYKREYSLAMKMLIEICEEVCEEASLEPPSRISAAGVWCQRDGETEPCDLLRIGTYGRRPPVEVIMKIADSVSKFGIIEMPDWFPLYGMY